MYNTLSIPLYVPARRIFVLLLLIPRTDVTAGVCVFVRTPSSQCRECVAPLSQMAARRRVDIRDDGPSE